MSIEKHLALGVGGGNLLFCGAGFSADCLSFSGEELGVSSPLLKSLNAAVDFEYPDLQEAADEYIDKEGEHGLLSMLSDKYAILKRTSSTDEILKYPWDRVYTTNFDDLISQSLTELSIPHAVANNTESKRDFEKRAATKKWVVHLHGALRSWDINNFLNSCVLGRESYMKIAKNSNWNPTLREDFARAKAIFFVGFSNTDFYLAEALYSSAGSKDKVFFINRESSGADRSLLAKQKKFGQSLSIGKDGFAEIIAQTNVAPDDLELITHSFGREELPYLPENLASVEDQEGFLVYGQYDRPLHYKDMFEGTLSYRAPRADREDIATFLTKDNAVGLVLGGICSGKTTLVEEVCFDLSAKGQTVFFLRSKYHDLTRETQKIVDAYPKAIFAIDDCFTLRDELRSVLKIINGAGNRLLLASRTLPYDSEEDVRTFLLEDTPFNIFDTEILDENEVEAIIECTNRIGGWGKDATKESDKKRIVVRENASRLSGFLLGRFNSDHIRSKFIGELDLFRTRGKVATEALILSFYLRHIGESLQISMLDEMLGADSVDVLVSDTPSPFITYDKKLKRFDVIASINARDALAFLFEDREVSLAVINALERLAPLRSEISFKSVYSQLMRYTQLKHVVLDQAEREFFFDRLSEFGFCRNNVLFWLQWSMAMRDKKDFARAKQYLDEAYGRSQNWENFVSHHLDDQKAGLMLEAAKAGDTSANYFRIFNEVTLIISRLVGRSKQTSHPYLTIKSMEPFFETARSALIDQHKAIIAQNLTVLAQQVDGRANAHQAGYVRDAMENARDICKSIVRDITRADPP